MKVKTTDELINQGTGVWKTIIEMNEQLKKFRRKIKEKRCVDTNQVSQECS